MINFGPRNSVDTNFHIDNREIYGKISCDEIVSRCEMLPLKHGQHYNERIGYFIDSNLSIKIIKIGHGWSGFSEREAYLESKDNFSKWDYTERSIHPRNIFVTPDDARIVIEQYITTNILSIRKDISVIESKIKNVRKNNFGFTIDEEFNIQFGNSLSCHTTINSEITESLYQIYIEELRGKIKNNEDKIKEYEEILNNLK